MSLFVFSPQSLLVAQQLANAVGGVMSGAAPGMNQPILIPFNTGGHLGGQQGLVLSLPTANIQSLVAAAAAGGLMTLPLQNLQGERIRQFQEKENSTAAKESCCKKNIFSIAARWWMYFCMSNLYWANIIKNHNTQQMLFPVSFTFISWQNVFPLK